MSDETVHLLDVNVAVALLDQAHVHHEAASAWFERDGRRWSLCAFTEAGVLRVLTRMKAPKLSMEQAAGLLESLKAQPGYQYQPITADWATLTGPFQRRLHGHNQITDAFLLGLAIREGLALVTFDQAIKHLAGEQSDRVLILTPK